MQQRVTALLSLFVATLLLLAPSAQAQDADQVRVTTSIKHDTSPALRSIPAGTMSEPTKTVIPNQQVPVRFETNRSLGKDPVLQSAMGKLAAQAPLTNFDALSNLDNVNVIGGRVDPPDPDMDVSANYIVEMVNLLITVYDKQGNQLMDPVENNAVFQGFGGSCEFSNNGDVIVMYDEEADRFLQSFMSWPDGIVNGARGIECVAISVTGDPTGEYYRYAFEVSSDQGVNDYPKLGVGPDGYYGAYNQFNPGFAGSLTSVFEKDSMLVGGDARQVVFGPSTARASLMPYDVDGEFPGDDEPGYFGEIQQDLFNIYAADVDWDDPQSATFNLVAALDTAPFDFNPGGIEQPGGAILLDALAGRLMQRLQFRRMDGFDAMVTSHVVDATGDGQAGMRWYEFRKDEGGDDWSIYQQGTYAPGDGLDRWMGSIAMNDDGAIGLMYSVSSSSVNPGIRYTGRPAGAPLGQMTFDEQTIVDGLAPKTGNSRWGDYSNVAVDPNGQTFWAVHEYGDDYGGNRSWTTRIASFAFDSNDDVPPGAIADLDAETAGSNVNLTWTAPADDAGDPESGPVAGYDIRFSADGPIESADDFEDATSIGDVPTPAEPGTEQSAVASDLEFETQYWFAIRAIDDNSNTSLSNSPSATTGTAPVLAISPEAFDIELESNEETTETLSIFNEGPADSELSFSFPGFAAMQMLAQPGIQTNDTSAPLDDASHSKGNDTFAGAGNPVVLGAGGPDDFGYTWIDSNEEGGPTFDYTDISEIGTAITLGDDAGETVSLPFTFEFYGEEKSEVTVSSNGYLTFGEDGTDFTNDAIPTGTDPNDLIAPFWDDLNPSAGGTVYFFDDAENNRFIVQYEDVAGFGGSEGDYSFQVVLTDGGAILIQYLDMESSGDLESASIGIENADASDGLQVAFNTAYVEDSLAVTIEAVPQFIADVDPAAGTVAGGEAVDVDVTFDAEGVQPGIYENSLTLLSNDPDQPVTNIPVDVTVVGGDPNIVVNPQALDFGEVFVNGETTRTFTILNDGGGPLEVGEINVEGTSDEYLLSNQGDFTLPFGDSVDVVVTYLPVDVGVDEATVNINSNDADTPTATVDLTGEGIPAPVLTTAPDSLFQELEIGGMATDTVTVGNDGESTLEFEAFFEETAETSPEDVAAKAPQSRNRNADASMVSAARTSGSPLGTPPAPVDPETATYQLDDGTAENALGLGAQGDTFDIMWLNAFEVVDGEATITELSTAWGAGGSADGPPAGSPATLYLYEDPNDDGDPSDAELLVSVDVTVEDPNTDMFQAASIDPTEVEGTFFIAALVQNAPPEQFPAPLDESSTYQDASWVIGTTTPGGFDADDLSSNEIPPMLMGDIGFPGNWLLRADSEGGGGGGGIIAVSPNEGTVAPGEETQLLVEYDATDLEVDTYTGDVVITSNDPENLTAQIPVTLEVGAAPYPFALSPDAIDVTIDLADGDTTNDATSREFNIENITDQEQFFLIETRGASGDAAPFLNFPTLSAQQDFQEKLAKAAAGDYPRGEAAPSMEAASGSRVRAFDASTPRLLDPIGVVGYSTSVFGALSGQYVSFDLGEPGDLMPFGDSPTIFAGDFKPGDDEVYFAVNSDNSELLTVDPETGETESVGTLSPETGAESWTDLIGNPTDGMLYGTTAGGTPLQSFLYEIDTDAAEATLIAEITGAGDGTNSLVIAGAVDADGTVYGHEVVSDELIEIDPATGEATVIGPTGFDANFAQGMDYDMDTGTLYMAAFNNAGAGQGELRTVDTETGLTSLVGPFEGGDELGYLALPSDGFLFVDVDLLDGTLAPFGDVTVNANIDATGLNAGTYEAEIVVISDEPGMPEDVIPVTLEVIGAPEAAVNPDALAFGEVFVGADTTQQITVLNNGNDDLEVSDIQLSPDVFSIADSVATSFTLAPDEARTFAVTFMPDAVQEYDGTFTVVSNNPDGNVSATLEGEGIEAPVLAVDPDALSFALAPGEEETQTLMVTNEGGSTLTYAIMDSLVSTPGEEDAPRAIFQDVLVEEDFDDGIPDDWAVVNNIEESVSWQLNSDNEEDNYTGGEGTAAAANSDFFGSAAYDTELRTPALTANADNLTLEFKANYQNLASLDTLDVDVSLDGGDSWTNILRWNEDHGGFFALPGEVVQLSLDSLVDAGDEFYVRWRYYDTRDGAFDWYAQIDDVKILRNLEFLAVDPASGSLDGGETDDVSVTADATALPLGTYEVDLNITSNDPVNSDLTVPVTITVTDDPMDDGVVVTPGPGPDSTRTVAPGEEFLVPIDVTSLEGLDVQSYQFTLSFLSDLVEPVGVETEGTLSDETVVAVNTEVPGQISVAAADNEGGDAPIFTIEGEGTLIFVRLMATEELGTTELAFTDFLFNEGAPEVTTETTMITVGQQAGDVSGDGQITAGDASAILDFVVGNIDLDEGAIEAGDVSGNGTLTAFDASLVLDFVVGNIDCFPVEPGCEVDGDQPALAVTSGAQKASAAGTLAWGAPRHSEAAARQSAGASSASPKTIQVPLVLRGSSGAARSVTLTTELDLSKVAFEGVESRLPDGWAMAHRVSDDGTLTLAAAGASALSEGEVATVTLRWLQADGSVSDKQLALAGQATLNEAAPKTMASVEMSVLPDAFAVVGNAPNPFRSTTKILVDLPQTSEVRLDVFDVIGRRVLTLDGQRMQPGSGQVLRVNAARLASGTYLYRVTATPLTEDGEGERQTETGRMVVVK